MALWWHLPTHTPPAVAAMDEATLGDQDYVYNPSPGDTIPEGPPKEPHRFSQMIISMTTMRRRNLTNPKIHKINERQDNGKYVFSFLQPRKV